MIKKTEYKTSMLVWLVSATAFFRDHFFVLQVCIMCYMYIYIYIYILYIMYINICIYIYIYH